MKSQTQGRVGDPAACVPGATYTILVESIATQLLQSGIISPRISMRAGSCRLYYVPPAGVVQLNVLNSDGSLSLYVNAANPAVIPGIFGAGTTVAYPIALSSQTNDRTPWYIAACSATGKDVAQAYVVATTSATIGMGSGVPTTLPPLEPGQRLLLNLPANGNSGGVVRIDYHCDGPSCTGEVGAISLYVGSGTIPVTTSTSPATSGQSVVSSTTDGVEWWLLVVVAPTAPSGGSYDFIVTLTAMNTIVLGNEAWAEFSLCDTSFGYTLFSFPPPGGGQNGVVRLEMQAGGWPNITLTGSLHPRVISLSVGTIALSAAPYTVADPYLRGGDTWYLLLVNSCQEREKILARMSTIPTQAFRSDELVQIPFADLANEGGKRMLRLVPGSGALLNFQKSQPTTPIAGLSVTAAYDSWPLGKGINIDLSTTAATYFTADGATNDQGGWYFLVLAPTNPPAGDLAFNVTGYRTETLVSNSTLGLSFTPTRLAALYHISNTLTAVSGGSTLFYDVKSSPAISVSIRFSACNEIPLLPVPFAPSSDEGFVVPNQLSCSAWVLLAVPATSVPATVSVNVQLVLPSLITANESFTLPAPSRSTAQDPLGLVMATLQVPLGPARTPPLALKLAATQSCTFVRVYAALGAIPDFSASGTTLCNNQWMVGWNAPVTHQTTWFFILLINRTNYATPAKVSLVTPVNLEVCNPVLQCSASGTCSDDAYNPIAPLCDCLGTFSYRYSEPYCEEKSRLGFWWFLIATLIVVWIVPLMVIYFYDLMVELLRKKRDENPQNININSVQEDAYRRASKRKAGLSSPEQPFDVVLWNVCANTSGNDFRLQGIYGRFSPGTLNAIMGPSGAGKSTLLNVLLGKVPLASGTIYINGHPDKLQRHKKNIGFVPQDDTMLLELSVKENVNYSASLRLPRKWGPEERTRRVRQVINTLGLHAVRHRQIGFPGSTKRVSGGQRKRTSIAMELVALPSVIFLDEPTSGLDSTKALELAQYLRTIADAGFTVIAVIHQPSPSVFSLFDNVMFLEKGELRYFGPPSEAGQFLEYRQPTEEDFSSAGKEIVKDAEKGALRPRGRSVRRTTVDPSNADDLIENISSFHWPPGGRDDQAFFEKEFRPPPPQSEGSQPPSLRQTSRFPMQIWIFFCRAVLQQKYNLRVFYINNILVAIAAMLLGFSFKNSHYIGPVEAVDAAQCPGFIYPQCVLPQKDDLVTQYMLTSMAVGLTAVAASLAEFGNERLVFWRESLAGTSETAYFLGKNLATVLNILIPPLVYCVIYYALTDGMLSVLDMYGVLLAVQFVCLGIGYTISMLMRQATSLIVGVVVIFIAIILSGFNPRLQDLKDDFGGFGPVVTWWSFARWSIEALYVGEVRQFRGIYNIEPGIAFWDYDEDAYARNLGILFVMAFVVRVLAWMSLQTFDRLERGKVPVYKKIFIYMQKHSPKFLLPVLGPVQTDAS